MLKVQVSKCRPQNLQGLEMICREKWTKNTPDVCGNLVTTTRNVLPTRVLLSFDNVLLGDQTLISLSDLQMIIYFSFYNIFSVFFFNILSIPVKIKLP